jgi:hypothetical protein
VSRAALRQQCTGSRRSAAQQIEEAVIRILIDWLTRPAKLVEPAGEVCIRSDQVRKMLGRAASRYGAA